MQSSENINLILKYESILNAAYNFWVAKNKHLNYLKYYKVIELIPYYQIILVVAINKQHTQAGCIFINDYNYKILNLSVKNGQLIINKDILR